MRVTRWLIVALLGCVPAAAACEALPPRLIVALTEAAGPLDAGSLAATLALPEALGVRRFDAGLETPAARRAVALARVLIVDVADSVEAARACARLAADPRVAWVERDVERGPALWTLAGRDRPASPQPAASADGGFPDDPLYRDTRQWGLWNAGPAGVFGGIARADIHAPEAWALGRGDATLLIGIADTGIDALHPELGGTLADGSPRIVFAWNATAEPGGAIADSFGHGTLVAGVMAARTNDGVHFDSLGVAGVAGGDGGSNPGCRIVPIKITSGRSGTAYASDEARGITWAVDHGCRTLNLSFAATSPSMLERLAILDAITRSCLVVCASGNRGTTAGSAPEYPAALAADRLCLQVGASDPWDARAAFSSYGRGLDLVAPGIDIWTTYMRYPSAAGVSYPGYVDAAGTSFAAPFATGSAGLLAAARPELAPDDLAELLRRTADDVGAPGPDAQTGRGRLNAARALAAVGPGIAIAHGVAVPLEIARQPDTLHVAGGLSPLMDQLGRRAAVERVTLAWILAAPDSFADSITVWTRIGGTTTLRDTTELTALTPWALAERLDPRHARLTGTLMHIVDVRADLFGADTLARWLPAPPESARIAWTLLGRRADRVAVPRPPGTGTPRTALRASPNPFLERTRLIGAPGGTIGLFDPGGRRVRTLTCAPDGGAFWDGRDETGRLLRPGLYLARAADGARLKLVRVR